MVGFGKFEVRELPEKKSHSVLIFPVAICLLVIVLAVLRIHGSSIGIYNQFLFGSDYQDKNLIIGTIRGIRSDEFMVQTPWILAQVNNQFTVVNPLVGHGIDVSFSGVPINDWTLLFKPEFWGYLILPVENAFAFMWWIRAAGLILVLYYLFLLISKRNIIFSVTLALSFFFSPFIQWWYSTNAVEIATFACAIFLCLIFLLHQHSLLKSVLGALGIAYFSICFALALYPPFQIPVVFSVVAVIGGYFLNDRQFWKWATLRRAGLLLIAALVLIAGAVGLFYFSHLAAISAVQNTVYPGSRVLPGGGLPPLLIFGGFFNIQLLDFLKTVPSSLGNQSEASTFFLLSIFLLPVMVFWEWNAKRERRHPDWILISLGLAVSFFLTWDFFGFPTIFAKITLFSLVPPSRTLLALGLLNFAIFGYYSCRYINVRQGPDYRIFAVIYSGFVAIFILYLGITLKQSYPQFIQNDFKIFMIGIAAGALLYFLLVQNRTLFGLALLGFTLLSAFSVNPLYIGLSPILDSKIAQTVRSINQSNPESKKWVVYDSFIFGNYLAANGIPIYSATYFYPDLELWHQLDPQLKYENIYNRYSHVYFKRTEAGMSSFESPQGDIVIVKIDPCDPALEKSGAGYFVFHDKVADACLEKVDEVVYPNIGFYIYRYKN